MSGGPALGTLLERFAVHAPDGALVEHSDRPFPHLRVLYPPSCGFALCYIRGRLERDGSFTPLEPEERYSALVDPLAARMAGETYEVVRYGREVVLRIGDDARYTETCPSMPAARAVFAEYTADPHGPAAPRPGDTLELLDSERTVTLTASTRLAGVIGAWQITDNAGASCAVDFGRYRLLARPLDTTAQATT